MLLLDIVWKNFCGRKKVPFCCLFYTKFWENTEEPPLESIFSIAVAGYHKMFHSGHETF